MSHGIPPDFFTEGLITEVLHTVKSGKEATVYCCLGGPALPAELAAVKVYRPVTERSFKNDALYWEGRAAQTGGRPDRRARKAVTQRSKHGRLAQMGTWAADEYATLEILWRAGARVPRPYARKLPDPLSPGTALCMEDLGVRHAPAPKLIETALTPQEAPRVFGEILDDIALFLALDRVHGDLSAYNILCWQGRAVVIDFPQSVDPIASPHALFLLERDIANVCEHFARYGIRGDAPETARAFWRKYWRREP